MDGITLCVPTWGRGAAAAAKDRILAEDGLPILTEDDQPILDEEE